MTAPLPPKRLEEIEARLAGATPGKWIAKKEIHSEDDEDDTDVWVDTVDENGNEKDICQMSLFSEKDSVFIAHAPTDLRDLLEEIKRLNRMAKMRKDYCKCGCPVIDKFKIYDQRTNPTLGANTENSGATPYD